MDLSKLPTLKSKLLSEKKLAKVWEYFMDHFGDHAEFINKSEDIRSHPELMKILGQILCANIYKTRVLPIEWRIMGYSKEHFYHGICSTPKGNVSFIYFDDIHVGSTLHFTGHYSGGTRFCRFIAEKSKDGSMKASLN